MIRIDPAAAEKRRERAEKKAQVSLYANENHTSALALEDIPAAQGAAARARISAIARAAKSAGPKQELALLEAMTAIGLLLGTLPLIGPPVPPDDDPGDPGDPGDPRDPGHPRDPGDAGPDEGPHDRPGPAPEDPAAANRGDAAATGPAPAGPAEGTTADPATGDEQGPEPEAAPWPPVPGTPAAAAPGCAPVPAGLLKQGRIKLLMPWRTLAAMAAEPGELSWHGTVTPGQARDLARAAATDAGARWP